MHQHQRCVAARAHAKHSQCLLQHFLSALALSALAQRVHCCSKHLARRVTRRLELGTASASNTSMALCVSPSMTSEEPSQYAISAIFFGLLRRLLRHSSMAALSTATALAWLPRSACDRPWRSFILVLSSPSTAQPFYATPHPDRQTDTFRPPNCSRKTHDLAEMGQAALALEAARAIRVSHITTTQRVASRCAPSFFFFFLC